MFITRQLKGLEDTKSPQFNRYFYLLEVSFRTYFIITVQCNFSTSLVLTATFIFSCLSQNIAWVKSYNICFELEDSNEIFTQLYRTLFSVIK